MNQFAAYARPVFMGYWAMIRLPRDGKPKPIQGKGGNPNVYPDRASALQACIFHLVQYLNGDYDRCGEIMKVSGSVDGHTLHSVFGTPAKGKPAKRHGVGGNRSNR